jgi:hypothetical protein
MNMMMPVKVSSWPSPVSLRMNELFNDFDGSNTAVVLRFWSALVM